MPLRTALYRKRRLTLSLPTEDRFLTSRSTLMDQLAMILGGRAIDDAHQRAAKVLLDHQAALHELAAILIEHETIDKEQFERLLHGEPARTVLVDDTPSEPAARVKARRAPTRRPTRRRAPQAKPLPGTAVARAVNPDDLVG